MVFFDRARSDCEHSSIERKKCQLAKQTWWLDTIVQVLSEKVG